MLDPKLREWSSLPMTARASTALCLPMGRALISVPQAFPLDISPDGSEFLVTQFTTSADMAPLWVVPVLAGSPWRVGNLMVNRVGASPSWMPQAAAWSPDMQRIAFARGNELY